MGAAVHALQKTVSAVVYAVEHVRKVVIARATNAIARGCRQHALANFLGKDEGGGSLLLSEILPSCIEHIGVAPDRDVACR